MEKKVEGISGAQVLTFRISGREMTKEKGYKLDSVLSTLQDANSLIKSTYLSLNNRQRFTDNDDEKIEVRLKEVREGSLVTDIGINCVNVILPMIPVLASDPEFILTTIKSSYKFLKAKITATKEGKEVEITQTTATTGINVAVTGNNNVVKIAAPKGVPEVADKLQKSISRLTENIDNRNVDFISIGSKKDSLNSPNNLELDSSDKELFAGKTLLTEDEFQLTGKIVSGNYETNKGKIEILTTDSDDLVVGNSYNVVIDDKLHIEEIWRKMFLIEKEYLAKCRMKKSSNGEYKVAEVLITDWFEDEN